jgi:hypothetical protein
MGKTCEKLVRTRNTQEVLVGKSEEREKLEDLDEEGMIT